MKTILTILITLSLLLTSFGIFSQTEKDTLSADTTSGKVYVFVDTDAEFPGGFQAMTKFIQDSTIYPKDASESLIQGYVHVDFVIKEDGSLYDIKVARGVHPLLDAEAVRVVKLFPKWTPGILDGKVVAQYYRVLIKFELTGGRRTKKGRGK